MLFILTIILAILGLLISCYDLYLEQQIETEPNYKPACDLSDQVSCSKPILSSYGKLFGFSNAIVGIIFYCLFIVFISLKFYSIALLMSIASVLVSAILAFILFTQIRSFCLICVSLYIINLLLCICSFFLYKG